MRDDGGPASETGAGRAPGAGVGVDAFGHDVAGALQGGFGVGHFAPDKASRVGVVAPGHEQVGQGAESPAAGHVGPRAAVWLIGKVEVFEFSRVETGGDAVAQVAGQAALPLNGREDGALALFEFAKAMALSFDGTDGHLVEPACGLLAVAADERDGGSFGKELHRGGHPPFGQAKAPGYDGNDRIHGDFFGRRHRAAPYLYRQR